MGRLVTMHILSDAICNRPGQDPRDLCEGLECPLPPILRALEELRRHELIVWKGKPSDPVTPKHASPTAQVQAIREVTGIDVERAL